MQGCLSDFIIYIIYLGVYYPLHTLWEAHEEETVTSPGYKIQVSPTTSCLALLNSQYISCLNIMTQTEKYPHLPSEKMG